MDRHPGAGATADVARRFAPAPTSRADNDLRDLRVIEQDAVVTAIIGIALIHYDTPQTTAVSGRRWKTPYSALLPVEC